MFRLRYFPSAQIIVPCAMLAVLVGSHPSLSDQICPTSAGRIVSLEGKADVLRVSTTHWTAGQQAGVLCPGDSVHLRSNSRATLYIDGQSAPIRLNEGTTLTLPLTLEKDRAFSLKLLKGKIHLFTRTPSSFTTTTPFVTAAVKGTEFSIEVDDLSTLVTVFEGIVGLTNDQGNLDLLTNESAITEQGVAPRKVVTVRPRDAVHWAIYYPPVIDPSSNTDQQPAINQASLQLGNVDEALAALEQVPQDERNERFHTLRASLFLSTGKVEAANRDIDAAFKANQESNQKLGVCGAQEYSLTMTKVNPPGEGIYQLRAVLRGISPLIWRRLLVRSDTTIALLHQVLQVAFGWEDMHLHRFQIRGREYGLYREGGVFFSTDAREVHLCDLGLRRLERFTYEYDLVTTGYMTCE
jgi:hypothetical protein